MDGRKNNGGTKGNKGGRRPKVDSDKVNTIFLTALKRIYSKDVDEDAKVEFVIELAGSQRGQIFIAEHLFGKPKESLDMTSNGNELGFSKITFIKD